MELTNIYKGSKLYKISPAASDELQSYSIPEVFSGMAILYEYEAAPVPPAELSAFLNKVIEGGLKLDPAQVIKANLCHSALTLPKLAEELRAKTVIIFGTDWMSGLHNTKLTKNTTIRLFGMKVLFTDPLDVIQTNDAAKKAFWGELKQLL